MTQEKAEVVDQFLSLYKRLSPEQRKEAVNRIIATHPTLVCRLIEQTGKCKIIHYGHKN